MKIKLLYFSWIREALGRDSEAATLPVEIDTVAEMLDWLATRRGAYAVFDDRTRLRCAIDQRLAPLSASLIGASEVALFPPVTGG